MRTPAPAAKVERGPWPRRTALWRRRQYGRHGDGGDRDVPDVEEGADTEDEEAPLVGADDQSTGEAADDDDPGEEGRGQDIREGETRGVEDEDEEQREVDEPLDVADKLQATVSIEPKRAKFWGGY